LHSAAKLPQASLQKRKPFGSRSGREWRDDDVQIRFPRQSHSVIGDGNEPAPRLHLLGQVTLPVGFLILAAAGEAAGEYVVHYGGGKTQHIPLRHGIEGCSGSLIHQASRLAPAAPASQYALTFVRDYACERFRCCCFRSTMAVNRCLTRKPQGVVPVWQLIRKIFDTHCSTLLLNRP
jgi:hypothetical protein